jgi:hypothetical protein
MKINRINLRKLFLRTTSSEFSSTFEPAFGAFLSAFSTTGGAPIVKIRTKIQSRLIVSFMINLKKNIPG